MLNDGYGRLTVDGLVKEIGTTRPTFYRRYPNIAHLAYQVIINRFGTGTNTEVDTGSLRNDLIQLQRQDVAMLSSPLMRKNLPGLLEEVRVDPVVRQLYGEKFLQPRRDNLGLVVERARARGENIRRDVDHEFLCDTLLGPLFVRMALPVRGRLDDHIARETAEYTYRFLTDVSAHAA